MRNRLLTRLGVIGVAGLLLQLVLPHLSEAAGLVVACLPIAAAGWYAAASFWRQARVHRGRQRAGVLFGAASGALLGGSYSLYTVAGLAGGHQWLETAADLASVSAAVVAVPAILVAVPPFTSWLARGTYLIDVATVAGAIFATAWQFALAPVAERLEPNQRAQFAVTVVAEILAASIALMVMSRVDSRHYRAMRVLAAGMGMFALAALISMHNQTQGLPWYASGLGAVYLIAGLIIALASRDTLDADQNTGTRSQLDGVWSTLPHLPVIIALASVAVPYVATGTLSPVLVGTLLGTSALAVVRQILNSLVVRQLFVDLEEQRHRLDHLAHHDNLTGLPNRAAFHARGDAVLAQAAPGTVTAVLLLDLDGFKQVNDTLGHAAGDALLTGAGERITRALRSGDIAARLGGDEFAVVVPQVLDLGDAVAVGERILREFARPMVIAGQQMCVRGSVGVTVTSEPGRTLDQLVHEADTALYEAKAAGKGQVRAYRIPSREIGVISSPTV
ncbi:diguanylate cyclase domain-containing protein [Actinoplanes sp. CA-015351]|uniref:diguanylate cyclase domain-containing protein n=1 Tax=Actinoplanes sp. CA-015351 TaxID=3239897 RepID=UPI003D95FA93